MRVYARGSDVFEWWCVLLNEKRHLRVRFHSKKKVKHHQIIILHDENDVLFHFSEKRFPEFPIVIMKDIRMK